MKKTENFSRRSFIKSLSLTAIAALSLSFSSPASAQTQSQIPGSFSSIVKAKNGSMLEFEGGFFVDTSQATVTTAAGGLNLSLPELLLDSPVTAERVQVDPSSTATRTVLKADYVNVGLLPNEIVFVAPIQKIDTANKVITVFSKDIIVEDQTLLLLRKKKKAKPYNLTSINSGDTVLVDALFVNNQLVARKVVKVENSVYGDAYTIIGTVQGVNSQKIELNGGVEIDLSTFIFHGDILPNDLMYFGFLRSQEATNPPLNKIFSVALSRNPRESYLAGNIDKIDLSRNSIFMFNREVRILNTTEFDGDRKNLQSLVPNQGAFVSFTILPTGEIVAKDVSQNDLSQNK